MKYDRLVVKNRGRTPFTSGKNSACAARSITSGLSKSSEAAIGGDSGVSVDPEQASSMVGISNPEQGNGFRMLVKRVDQTRVVVGRWFLSFCVCGVSGPLLRTHPGRCRMPDEPALMGQEK